MNNKELHHPDDSRLRKMAGQGPEFRTPAGYFDQFPAAISERIAKPVTGKGIITMPRIAVLVPLMLVVVAAVYYLTSIQQESGQSASYLTYDEIVSSGYVSDFDEQTLYLEATAVQTYDSDYYEYKNYLIENNIDITLIISEL